VRSCIAATDQWVLAKHCPGRIQTPLHLKNKYGSGFKLTVASKVESVNLAQRCVGTHATPICRKHLTFPATVPTACHTLRYSYVEALLPEGFKRLDSFAGNFSYEFPYRPNVLADLFEELTERASEHGIVDWGISQTTYAHVTGLSRNVTRANLAPFAWAVGPRDRLEEVFLRIIREADAEAD